MLHKSFPPWSRRLAALAASAVLTVGAAAALAPTAQAEIDVYSAPGDYRVNGREWRTTCEPYSQTQRCRTEIWSTQVTQVNGRFVAKQGWYFNNLSYLSSPRNLWTKNPLGAYGVVGGSAKWTATDGRKWNTVCDTAVTGRGGCRSYVTARVIEAYRTSKGTTAYHWVTRQVFNNIVRFGPLPVFKNLTMGSTVVSLKYFDITVSNPVWDGEGTAFGAKVKVCYTHAHPDAGSDGKVRTSLDPWQFGGTDLESFDPRLIYYEAREATSSGLWTPLYAEKRLALGECNTGYISDAHGSPDLSLQFKLRYAAAGSADRITWSSPS